MSLTVVGETSLTQCSFGLTPTPLTVLPDRTVLAETMLMGNITDIIPLANVGPYGLCISLANPAVAAATAAAGGILVPMPCVPVTPAPWVSGALNVLVSMMPAIDQTAFLMCSWGGVIIVEEPGNLTVMVP
jgi:hypothetical protein